ncbi:hypothetical protein BCLUESOX_2361 [bacterium endosymbiont of Bathymodiolus sp. 5 South]|nr:hypothetical protein BCLUESOX_2361 [bacterium endosymbiont of Bathymodiolus sp. 5 South]VVH56190.1 hypothetical protein BSPCLSOX_2453 [uncultured Gammaproteobacteria bacterium]
MLEYIAHKGFLNRIVSVAGCLGYDVLETRLEERLDNLEVSVAGCLGYDVLDHITMNVAMLNKFQLLVV